MRNFYLGALLLLLLPACGDMLENGARLDRPRVLAVKVHIEGDLERATPAPGETADLRWLVASSEDVLWTGGLVACIQAPNQTGVPGCAGEPFATLQATTPSLEPVTEMTLPPAEAFVGSTGSVLLVGVFCAGGTLTLDGCSEDAIVTETVVLTLPVQLDGPGNRHPTISDETIMYDEATWEPPPETLPSTGCLGTESTPGFPHVPWRDAEDPAPIGISTQEDDREAYQELVFGGEMPELVDSREELTLSHITSHGQLARRQSIIFEDETPDASVPWEHPPADEVPADGLTVKWIFVARDGRGGMDWTRRALCLEPAL